MKTKKITYKIKKPDYSQVIVEGAQINMFTAARKMTNDDDSSYWRIDHIQSGGRIFDVSTYTLARRVGNAFMQACSKPNSEDPQEIIDTTDNRFVKFLYDKEFEKFEDFLSYTNSEERDR